jgi:hypothetical protein
MLGAQYRAGEPSAVHDGASAKLALPADAGGVVGAALPGGWPVWIVHHEDGSVTVISGVAGEQVRKSSPQRPFFERDAWLVRWIPGMRRFVAGGLVYDDHGRMLGYMAFDACLDECPELKAMPREQRDLDTFDAMVEGNEVRVGTVHAGAAHAVSDDWVPWMRKEPDERRTDANADARAAVAAISIPDATARPAGTYAIVEGSVVRATNDVPRVCSQKACEPCARTAPPITGVSSDRANEPSVEAQRGVFLVHRAQDAGFVVIARIARGECSGEAAP